jgi:anti-anti-sigma factor
LTTTLQAKDAPVVHETETIDGVQVVRFRKGRIFDDDNARELGDGLKAVLEATAGPARIVVDLVGVTLLSSASIAKLIVFKRRVRERGGEVRIGRPCPQVARSFRIANLWDFLSVHSELGSALGSFD